MTDKGLRHLELKLIEDTILDSRGELFAPNVISYWRATSNSPAWSDVVGMGDTPEEALRDFWDVPKPLYDQPGSQRLASSAGTLQAGIDV